MSVFAVQYYVVNVHLNETVLLISRNCGAYHIWEDLLTRREGLN